MPCFSDIAPRLDPRTDGRRAALAERHAALDDVGAAERERRRADAGLDVKLQTLLAEPGRADRRGEVAWSGP